MKMTENRSYNGTLEGESEGRLVSGYAVRFGERSQNLGFYETIAPGALTQEVIDSSDIFARLNHREDAILARSRYGEGSLTLELREDGLYYMFEAPHTQFGDELLEHIKRGEISTSSFAFTIDTEDKTAQRWYKENGELNRTIYKIDRLYDIAPTYEGAYLTTSCSARSVEEVEKVSSEIDEKMENIRKEIESL